MHGDGTGFPGQPDYLAGAGHVGRPQGLVGVDEVHQRTDVVDDVDVPRELAEHLGRQAEPRLGEVAGEGNHAVFRGFGQIVARRRGGDAVARARIALCPDEAPDPRVRGRQQLPQQMGAEESGRSGQQDFAGRAPAGRPRRHAVPVDGDPEPGLGGEVDVLLVAVGVQLARAGVPGGSGERAQRGLTQQAAGERARGFRRDAEDGARVRQHLRGEQRVAAEVEEVVVEADVLVAEQPGPQGRRGRPGSASAARRSCAGVPARAAGSPPPARPRLAGAGAG